MIRMMTLTAAVLFAMTLAVTATEVKIVAPPPAGKTDLEIPAHYCDRGVNGLRITSSISTKSDGSTLTETVWKWTDDHKHDYTLTRTRKTTAGVAGAKSEYQLVRITPPPTPLPIKPDVLKPDVLKPIPVPAPRATSVVLFRKGKSKVTIEMHEVVRLTTSLPGHMQSKMEVTQGKASVTSRSVSTRADDDMPVVGGMFQKEYEVRPLQKGTIVVRVSTEGPGVDSDSKVFTITVK